MPPTTDTNKLVLRPCNSADIPTLAAINLAAFDNPRNKVMYLHIAPSDRFKAFESKARRTLSHQEDNSHPDDETIHYLCVVEPTTGTIVANAVWNYLPRGYIPSQDLDTHHTGLAPGTNQALAQDFADLTHQLRSSPPRHSEPQWLLSLLATHPKHQGQGAGTQLIEWGTSKAEAMGVRCFVDASPAGMGLYRRLGFDQEVGDLVLDLAGYEGGEQYGVQRWVGLAREAASMEKSMGSREV
ncbi:MAG: hypothetical protein LQ349_003582 [Xanthoria aureola]|nr:MAG: hypothetical protein LQ349_003582 [Xanthoria aureola]